MKLTTIQWADTTVNPIMGCGGCELFPSAAKVLAAIDDDVESGTATRIDSKILYQDLVADVFSKSPPAFPHIAHNKSVTTTNIWHLKERFKDRVSKQYGQAEADLAMMSVRQSITCYAAVLHLNRGTNILDREGRSKERDLNNGHAPTFESVTRFPGRSAKASKLVDLWEMQRADSPWKDGLPRLIFVSDMGDAFSAVKDFKFLKEDLMTAVESVQGSQHLWLWLTKRPERMALFAEEIGGFPANVCAMTTLTGPDPESLNRLAAIKKVKAHVRGLSIEPLWDRIPLSSLNLDGIDWVIVGGESGSGVFTRPFELEWAEELREHCRKHGVAFFLKQLGQNPMRGIEQISLKDSHGGDWEEWETSLRVREFPKAFYQYRVDTANCPVIKADDSPGATTVEVLASVVVDTDQEDFTRLDQIVRNGVRAFIECGKALAEIHDRQLWKLIPDATWESYCRGVIGMSKPHAHRLVEASQFAREIVKSLPNGNDLLPVAESQMRPLKKLETPEERLKAWKLAVFKAGGQPTGREVLAAVADVRVPAEPTEPRPTRVQQRAQLISRLREVVSARGSWKDIEQIIEDLEGLA